MYMYTRKQNNNVNISTVDLDWIFPDKYTLKIGVSLEGFRLNITPKVNDDLIKFFERSTCLINSKNGQEEFSSIPTKGHFSSRS